MLLQEEGLASYNKRQKSIRKLPIIFLILCTLAGASFANPLHKSENPEANSANADNLITQITQIIKSLEYSEKNADDFILMLPSWDYGRAIEKLNKFKQQLRQSNLRLQNDTVNLYNMAQIEKTITKQIHSMITEHIQSDYEIFELPDIINKTRANCLGFTQLFYILATSVGLRIQPINIIEFQSAFPEMPGAAHIACIVRLADNSIIMVNPVPNGSISNAFYLSEKYTTTGTCLQLNNKNNPLNLYRSIQLLNGDGLLSQLYNSRGCECSKNNQPEQAVTCFTKAIELNPDYAQAYNNRGVAYRKTGLLENALSDYARSVEINPGFLEAYNNFGIAYRQADKHKLALDCYNHAIEINPEFAEAYNNKAILHLDMGQTEQAVEDFSKAIKLNKNLFQAYYNRAVAYSISQEFKKALSDFNRAIKLNRNLPALYYGRANTYTKLKKFDSAIKDYNRAIELDPEFTKARDNLQIAYALAGKSEPAE